MRTGGKGGCGGQEGGRERGVWGSRGWEGNGGVRVKRVGEKWGCEGQEGGREMGVCGGGQEVGGKWGCGGQEAAGGGVLGVRVKKWEGKGGQ